MSMARVLIPKRYCSGDVRVLLFSVGSVGRVKFGARVESGGCGGGSFFLFLCVFVCTLYHDQQLSHLSNVYGIILNYIRPFLGFVCCG